MHKQLRSPPPLRNQPLRNKAARRPKDISFSEALDKLKRGFKVKRALWNGFCLELIEDSKGDKHIYSHSIEGRNQGIRHTFDQSEILSNDWMVL